MLNLPTGTENNILFSQNFCLLHSCYKKPILFICFDILISHFFNCVQYLPLDFGNSANAHTAFLETIQKMNWTDWKLIFTDESKNKQNKVGFGVYFQKAQL